MPFPLTREAMEDDGFRRSAYTRCRGCNRPMEWWHTPAGKRLPMDPMEQPDSPAISHYATCPEAAQFRKKPAGRALVADSPDRTPTLFSNTEED